MKRSQLRIVVYLLIAPIIGLVCTAMYSNQLFNKGSYSLVRKRNPSPQSQISGKLVDKETKEALKIAIVEINGQRIKADTNGHYYLVVKLGSYVVTGLCYPYYRVTTNRFKIKAGDVITINFQLLIDKTPLK